jgi:predicted transcriptional regulator
MGEMMSVRVGAKARRAVYRVAKSSGKTQSDVVREAIEEYVARHGSHAARTV